MRHPTSSPYVFALRGNWMRSILTALGVIIGIAAVIIMVRSARAPRPS